jgi:hypothetical protein
VQVPASSAAPQVRSQQEMPASLRAALAPGDAVLFNAWGFHRGRYHVDKPRRTLMFTYTPASMPTFDYFSDQPWFLDPAHLDNLNPGTKRFCPGPPGRLSALSVFLCKSVFYGAFVWARRALNSQKRWFSARAVRAFKDAFEPQMRARGSSEESKRIAQHGSQVSKTPS